MIELIDVWKRFGGEWVLKSVNVEIGERGLVAITGENGSGKTTLIKIMCGLLRPNRGTVKIDGRDIRFDRDYRMKVGVLLHENLLYEELSVEENLKFYSKAYGTFSDLAREVFSKLELERYRDVRVKNLSFGWKKRANFVRALINDPKIVLLDEPFSGLDEVAREMIKDIIVGLAEDRLVVFTTPVKPDLDCRILSIENGVLNDRAPR